MSANTIIIGGHEYTVFTVGEYSSALFPPAAVYYSCLGAGTSSLGTASSVLWSLYSSTNAVRRVNEACTEDNTATISRLLTSAGVKILSGLGLFAFQRTIATLEANPATSAGVYGATLLPIAIHLVMIGTIPFCLVPRHRASVRDEESGMEGVDEDGEASVSQNDYEMLRLQL